VLADESSTDKSPFVSKRVSFASTARDRRSSCRVRVFHGATHDEDEGCADELRDVVDDSDSEAPEDWEDGTTLFSGFVESNSL
jgi:hypothetical protein